MTQSPGKGAMVAQYLGRIRKFCDRGFALAIHIRYTRPTLLYQTYSQDWADHYSVKGYMLSDPTVLWGLEHTGHLRWSDLIDKDAAGVFQDALTFGLTNGFTYATGPASSRTISSGAKSGDDFSDAETDEFCRLVDLIHAETEGFDQFPAADQDALRKLV